MLKITARDIWVCIFALLLSGIFCLIIYSGLLWEDGENVEIYWKNEKLSTYSLNESQKIDLTNDEISLIIEISDHSVRVINSECSGKDCVHTSPISKEGQIILCAPQQILIKITNNATDAILQ